MTEQKFKSEMRRADTMRKTSSDPLRAEYWVGYIRGLRRGHHGESFGSESSHRQWLSMAESPDEMRAQRGQGYADGLQFVEVASQVGRPPVGDTVLDKLTVPSELKSALEAKAAELGISVPGVRREAYRKFTE